MFKGIVLLEYQLSDEQVLTAWATEIEKSDQSHSSGCYSVRYKTVFFMHYAVSDLQILENETQNETYILLSLKGEKYGDSDEK